jgi:TetR/AcrR family transcriptional regulator, fatty acid metabolism regulator protein
MNQLTRRQKEIVTAAIAIIDSQGSEALTIKGIADRVGFKDAAVYRHFKSKGGILAAIAGEFFQSSRIRLESLQRSELGTIDLIRGFYMDRLHIFATNRTITTVMFSENLFRTEPTLQKQVLTIMESHRSTLVAMIKEGQNRGEITALPADHLFMLMMGSLRLLVTSWRATGYIFDLEQTGTQLWQSIVTLIRIRPEAATARLGEKE